MLYIRRKFLIPLILLVLTVGTPVHSHNSLLEFENNTRGIFIKYIYKQTIGLLKKVILNPYEFEDSVQQALLGENYNAPSVSIFPADEDPTAYISNMVSGYIERMLFPPSFVADFLKFFLYGSMLHVVQPHEDANLRRKSIEFTYDIRSKEVKNVHNDALTEYDLPFYFRCRSNLPEPGNLQEIKDQLGEIDSDDFLCNNERTREVISQGWFREMSQPPLKIRLRLFDPMKMTIDKLLSSPEVLVEEIAGNITEAVRSVVQSIPIISGLWNQSLADNILDKLKEGVAMASWIKNKIIDRKDYFRGNTASDTFVVRDNEQLSVGNISPVSFASTTRFELFDTNQVVELVRRNAGVLGPGISLFRGIFNGLRLNLGIVEIEDGKVYFSPFAIAGVDGYAYYRIHDGELEVCAAVLDTILPLKIGCIKGPPIPRPALRVPEDVEAQMLGTRCKYILSSNRPDLKGYGSYSIDGDSRDRRLRRFLIGDMHPVSTAAGCIEDLTKRTFFASARETDQTFVTESIMVKSLRYLTPVVYAALVLYAIIFGIKVIIGSVRSKAEIFLAVIKFALILYLINPNVWFNPETGDGYALSLLEIPKELLSYVASVDKEFDGTGACIAGHGINKEHIFNEEVVPGSGYRTHGFDGIKLTVWDWIDCKLLNLVNIGLCNYSSFSLTMLVKVILKTLFSLIMMAFLPGGAAPFAIWTIIIVFWGMVAMIIYAAMLALLTLKAVFVILTSMLILSVLIVIAPLMLVFSLFEATKQMFENWFNKVFGYTMYPVFFVFVLTFIYAILSYVIFGSVEVKAGNIAEQCLNKNNLFCNFVRLIGGDPCSNSDAQMINSIQGEYGISLHIFKGLKIILVSIFDEDHWLINVVNFAQDWSIPFNMYMANLSVILGLAYNVLELTFILWILYSFCDVASEIVANISGIYSVASPIGTELLGKAISSGITKGTDKVYEKLRKKPDDEDEGGDGSSVDKKARGSVPDANTDSPSTGGSASSQESSGGKPLTMKERMAEMKGSIMKSARGGAAADLLSGASSKLSESAKGREKAMEEDRKARLLKKTTGSVAGEIPQVDRSHPFRDFLEERSGKAESPSEDSAPRDEAERTEVESDDTVSRDEGERTTEAPAEDSAPRDKTERTEAESDDTVSRDEGERSQAATEETEPKDESTKSLAEDSPRDETERTESAEAPRDDGDDKS